ncbi:MAG: PIG-L family deacetylase [Anaerolineaceae bacterium]|jgi:LmbE family N-acetylglucosaminyl deacetylase|nr:PIG-L family deacetylase [Anaerolineaceae bacterium]
MDKKGMLFYGKRICFIGAHPDDIEIGAGALISNLSDRADVMCVTLSDNQKNPALTNVVNEHHDSMDVLGVPPENRRVEPFVTRYFPQARQEILEYLFKLNQDFQPDIVFTHSQNDIHQDHNTVTEEVLRAFRGITVLGFDVIRSSYGFFPHFLVSVTEEDVQRKIDALAQYKTYADKYYFSADLTRSILVRNGAFADSQYAEGFDILRIVSCFGMK